MAFALQRWLPPRQCVLQARSGFVDHSADEGSAFVIVRAGEVRAAEVRADEVRVAEAGVSQVDSGSGVVV
jgi:hypothetical protein